MKFLGIDFGSKRIGLALSDETAHFALPFMVIPAQKESLEKIKDIISDKNITHIVIGESKDFSMKDNDIMKKTRIFADEIATATGLPVFFEPEFLTSVQASHFQGEGSLLDASAAALILQSYLDRRIYDINHTS